MTFDLTAYAGQTVLIGFRYMTDSGTLGAGWWIQSAKTSGAAVTLAPASAPLPANFQVSVVRVYVTDGVITDYQVNDMDISTPANTGNKGCNINDAPNYIILVASCVSRKGSVDYAFQAQSTPIGRSLRYVDLDVTT
jgi:hypothetical protein